MNKLKIVIHLRVITFTSVSFPAVNIIIGNLIFVIVLNVVFRIFCSSPELLCAKFDRLTFNSALCINTGQDKGALVIGSGFRIIIGRKAVQIILDQFIVIFKSYSNIAFI